MTCFVVGYLDLGSVDPGSPAVLDLLEPGEAPRGVIEEETVSVAAIPWPGLAGGSCSSRGCLRLRRRG